MYEAAGAAVAVGYGFCLGVSRFVRRVAEMGEVARMIPGGFPAISTGIYGFPSQRAAKIAVREILSYTGGIEGLFFVCFDAETAGIYRADF